MALPSSALLALLDACPDDVSPDAILAHWPASSTLPGPVIARLSGPRLTTLLSGADVDMLCLLGRNASDPTFLESLWRSTHDENVLASIASNPACHGHLRHAALTHAMRNPDGMVMGSLLLAMPDDELLDLVSLAPQLRRGPHDGILRKRVPRILVTRPVSGWVDAVSPVDLAAAEWLTSAAGEARLDAEDSWTLARDTFAAAGRIPRSLCETLCGELFSPDDAFVRQALAACPCPDLLALAYRERPGCIDFSQVLETCGEVFTQTHLGPYLLAQGLGDDVWAFIRDHAQLSVLRSVRQFPADQDFTAAIDDILSRYAAGATERSLWLAAYLFDVAPARDAVRLLSVVSRQTPSHVSAARAAALLEAGAPAEAVMACASRWSRPDWNHTPLVRAATIAHGPAEGVWALTLTVDEVSTCLARIPTAPADLVLAIAGQTACSDLDEAKRRDLLVALSSVLTVSTRPALAQPAWARADDARWLVDNVPVAAERFAGALAAQSYANHGAVLGDFSAGLLAVTRLDWPRVQNPWAWQIAARFLADTLASDARSWETAVTLLDGWAGSLDELVAASARLSCDD